MPLCVANNCLPDGNLMNETISWALLLALLGSISPEAAAGAVCGGLFFWSLSPEIPLSTRAVLAVASIGMGYGAGLAVLRSDEWLGWAWVVSGLVASLIYAVIVSVRGMVKTGSPLPPWLVAILDIIPWRNRRGDQ